MAKVVLKDVRLSFPSLTQPKAMNEEEKANYQATLLMDKQDPMTDINIKALESAIDKAIDEYREKGGKFTRQLIKRHPVKDGDVEVNATTGELNEHNKGLFYIQAKTLNKPMLVDVDNVEFLLDEDVHKALYAGAYAHVQLQVYVYDNKFGKGLSVKLGAIKQSAKIGERFGSGPETAEDIFADM